MKNTLSMFFVVFTCATTFAQINKGQFLVGGTGAFSMNQYGGYKSSQLTLSPNAGYFFLDKLAGGLDVSFSYGRIKYSGGKSTGNTYGISPFLRYYVLPSKNKINLFAEASYGWGKSDGTVDNVYSGKTTYNGYSLSAGPAIFITPNISVELTAGFTKNYHRNKDAYYNSTNKSKEKLFQIGVGFQIHLGNGKR